jgi:ribosomal-protein-alanine N-acetyltransferase
MKMHDKISQDNIKIIIPIIETKKLILRELNPEIYDYIFQNLTDNELMDFLGINNTDLSIEKENHKKGFTTWSMTFKIWQIIDKTTGKIIGNCGFHYWYIHQLSAEIGYEITAVEYRGKGLMNEAIEKIIEYGFTKMNLNRIEAFINPENTQSLKLIQNFKFMKEGLLRERFFRNNEIGDHVVFSLLKKEFNM